MVINKAISIIKELTLIQKLSGILVFLLIISLVIDHPWSNSDSYLSNETQLLPYLSTESINEITITEDENVINLQKKEGLWQLVNGQSFPADEKKINELILKLNSIQKEEIVSKNPDRMNLFEVDEKSAKKITASKGDHKKVVELYIGKIAPSNKQYVRLANSNETLKVNQSLSQMADINKENWKDKTILKADEAETKRLTLVKEGEETIIEKKGNEWILTQYNNTAADQLAIRTLFERIKHLSADRFANSLDGSQVNFDNPDYKISVRRKDEGLNIVLFKKGENDAYFVKNGESQFIFMMDEASLNNIFNLEFGAKN